MTVLYKGITYVIPCGKAKLDRAAPARDLYTGSMFRHTLASVEALARGDVADGRPARVLVLSALHGLIELGQVIEPYDLRMGQPGSVNVDQVTGQALALGIDWTGDPDDGVYAFLPGAYLRPLDEALRRLDVYVQDVYEGCGGIGEQRRVNAHVAASGVPETVSAVAVLGAVPADPDGLTVWLGTDVSGLWWGEPVLVSYGRLREAKTLPVATAPWVCDSRAFTEITQHGRWTISPERYVADLRRYHGEIGKLVWAAPQDWPAAPAMLAKTGLTEDEHQRLTTASVLTLRGLAPELPIITVVTGETVAGYLRHVRMYADAGIDLRAENLVVGVGALVGRPPTEVATIIGVLHSAGLKRLHGFGVKGPALELVGGLLESVDSAGWSDNASRHIGRCPHGVVVHEANCPVGATIWRRAQQARAAHPTQEGFPLDLVG